MTNTQWLILFFIFILCFLLFVELIADILIQRRHKKQMRDLYPNRNKVKSNKRVKK